MSLEVERWADGLHMAAASLLWLSNKQLCPQRVWTFPFLCIWLPRKRPILGKILSPHKKKSKDKNASALSSELVSTTAQKKNSNPSPIREGRGPQCLLLDQLRVREVWPAGDDNAVILASHKDETARRSEVWNWPCWLWGLGSITGWAEENKLSWYFWEASEVTAGKWKTDLTSLK